MTSVGFACNLGALTPAQRKRHAALIAKLAQLVQTIHELPQGFAITYKDASVWNLITEWISLERLCCPFLTFTLRLVPDQPIQLDLTGPDGVKAFLAEELSLPPATS